MDLNLEGRVVVVTGAARGIGRAIALAFAKEKAHVVVTDIDLELANQVADKARTMGANAIALELDVTSIEQAGETVQKVLADFGKLDILINNAGVAYLPGDDTVVRNLFHESSEDDWPAEINVTLFGVMNCTRKAIEPMIKQKSGTVINIVSDAGRHHSPRVSIYSAGKGGIIALSGNLAYELGPHGIRVNCVSPGIIKTTRMERIEAGEYIDPEAVKNVRKLEALAKETTPVGRMGTPQDVANVVVFLASDVSSYIVGQTISVNGGRLMP